jgi:hypothetical protein
LRRIPLTLSDSNPGNRLFSKDLLMVKAGLALRWTHPLASLDPLLL